MSMNSGRGSASGIYGWDLLQKFLACDEKAGNDLLENELFGYFVNRSVPCEKNDNYIKNKESIIMWALWEILRTAKKNKERHYFENLEMFRNYCSTTLNRRIKDYCKSMYGKDWGDNKEKDVDENYIEIPYENEKHYGSIGDFEIMEKECEVLLNEVINNFSETLRNKPALKKILDVLISYYHESNSSILGILDDLGSQQKHRTDFWEFFRTTTGTNKSGEALQKTMSRLRNKWGEMVSSNPEVQKILSKCFGDEVFRYFKR